MKVKLFFVDGSTELITVKTNKDLKALKKKKGLRSYAIWDEVADIAISLVRILKSSIG